MVRAAGFPLLLLACTPFGSGPTQSGPTDASAIDPHDATGPSDATTHDSSGSVRRPRFVGAGPAASALNTAGSLSGIAVPSKTAPGDLLVLSVTWREDETSGPSVSGWQELARSDRYTRAAYGYKSATFTRLASAVEPAVTVEMTTAVSNLRLARIYGFRGVDPSAPIEGVAYATKSAGVALVQPTLRTSGAERLGIALLHTSTIDPASVFSGASGGVEPWSEPVAPASTSDNSDAGLQLQTIPISAAGAVTGGAAPYDRGYFVVVAALAPSP